MDIGFDPKPLLHIVRQVGQQARRRIEQEDLTHMECLCGKKKPILEFQIKNSGVVKYVENLCGDCRKNFRECSLIICVRCKRVVMALTPHRDAVGFVFAKGGIYHLKHCHHCNPDICQFERGDQPIEKIIFDQRIGRK